jgi:hypothetical protein
MKLERADVAAIPNFLGLHHGEEEGGDMVSAEEASLALQKVL